MNESKKLEKRSKYRGSSYPWPLNIMKAVGLDPDESLSKDFIEIFNKLNNTYAKLLSLKYFNALTKEELMKSMNLNRYYYEKYSKNSISELKHMLENSEVFKKYFTKSEPSNSSVQSFDTDSSKKYSSPDECVDLVSKYIRHVVNKDPNNAIKSIYETNIDELKNHGMSEEAYRAFRIRDINTVGNVSNFLSANTFKPNKKLCITLSSLKSVYRALSELGVNIDQYTINSYVDPKKKNMAEVINKYMITQSSKQACRPSDRDVDISEEVIDYLADYINWDLVAGLVKMSPAFIERHIDRISFIYLSYNRHMNEAFIEKHLVDYEFNHNLLNLFFNGVVSLNFIHKHGTQDQLYYACKYMNNRSDQNWLKEF